MLQHLMKNKIEQQNDILNNHLLQLLLKFDHL